ncbi:hypothetical protein [Agriterribacter sp.]|uniref:hypothetical protein n=1 Tax=Agriterribacter sp. TaxID=2821509 RepID=UPI002B9B4C54|nr:hypothetical protein [Agriterribacter sp.]HRP57032.1 hypothetical protein [Agriterribacter sp.]
MKRITPIFIWTFICFACNRSASSTGNEAQPVGDSDATEHASPTPGLGYDPTRNDTREEDPLGPRGSGDSSVQEGKTKPTPGLGNDPTRNNPSNRYASPEDSSRGQNPAIE